MNKNFNRRINYFISLFFCYQIGFTVLQGEIAPLFKAKIGSGKVYNIKDLYKKRPVFIYFINESCPTNAKAFPFLKKIYSSYKSSPFYGVINADKEDYLDWQKTYSAPFPLFLDPDMKIIKAYKVARSPWIIKIDQTGKISKIWQGYSQSALNEINNEIAKTLKIKPITIDFSSAPKELRGG